MLKTIYSCTTYFTITTFTLCLHHLSVIAATGNNCGGGLPNAFMTMKQNIEFLAMFGSEASKRNVEGNKIDNIYNRAVTEAEGEELARKNGMMFIETSAKEKIGVNEAFEEVVNKVIESPLIDEVSLRRRAPGNNAPG